MDVTQFYRGDLSFDVSESEAMREYALAKEAVARWERRASEWTHEGCGGRTAYQVAHWARKANTRFFFRLSALSKQGVEWDDMENDDEFRKAVARKHYWVLRGSWEAIHVISSLERAQKRLAEAEKTLTGVRIYARRWFDLACKVNQREANRLRFVKRMMDRKVA